MSAGIPAAHQSLLHAVNFNDLDSVRYVCERYPIGALITEPILQNIGLVKPRPGYLQGLRDLADEFGFLLIFDEIKTGFRHAFGGYAEVSGVLPDLAVYGKAIASGLPAGGHCRASSLDGVLCSRRSVGTGIARRHVQRSSRADGGGGGDARSAIPRWGGSIPKARTARRPA